MASGPGEAGEDRASSPFRLETPSPFASTRITSRTIGSARDPCRCVKSAIVSRRDRGHTSRGYRHRTFLLRSLAEEEDPAVIGREFAKPVLPKGDVRRVLYRSGLYRS